MIGLCYTFSDVANNPFLTVGGGDWLVQAEEFDDSDTLKFSGAFGKLFIFEAYMETCHSHSLLVTNQ